MNSSLVSQPAGLPLSLSAAGGRNQALNLAMQDGRFKTQLFRFIDVLPSITDDEQVVTLAREYLDEADTATLRRPMGTESALRHQLGGLAQREGDQEPD